MAGFPLMAIGAGIGQAAKAYQEQQEARQRTMMLQLQLQRYQRELDKEKIEDEAAGGRFDPSLLGGGVRPVAGGMMGGASLSPSGGGEGFATGGIGGGIPSAASLPPMTEDGIAANMGRNFAAPGAPPRAPLPAGQGGAFRSAGDQWMASTQGVPLGLGSDMRAGPWSGRMADAPADALPSLEASGMPGTSAGWSPGPVTLASGSIRDATMPTIPPRTGRGAPQMAPQGGGAPQGTAPQPAQAGQSPGLAGVNIPPPELVDWGRIVTGIAQQNPGMSPKARALFAKTTAEHMGKEYDRQFKEWQAKTGFGFEALRDTTTRRGQDLTQDLGNRQLTETARGHDLTYGATTRGQDLTAGTAAQGDQTQRRGQDLTAASATQGNRTTERGQDLTAGTAAAGQRTTERGQDLTSEVANRNAATAERNARTAEQGVTARIDKVQDKQKLTVSAVRTLAERSRYLLEAIEGNPNLVGTRGMLDRYMGTIMEQAGQARFKEQKADFDSLIALLRQEIKNPMKISGGYLTKPAIEQMQKLVPSDEALTSPSQAKAALRNLAKHLDEQADQLETVMGGVKKDFEANDDAIREWMKQHGMGTKE